MQADAFLQKDVLTCSQVSLSLWKIKYLSNTESEPGLSSEDEAVGMPLHKAVTRRLPGYWGGGTSTEGEGVLQPHQMAVDKQELQRLHHLTGAYAGFQLVGQWWLKLFHMQFWMWVGRVPVLNNCFFLFQFYTIVIQN